MKNIHILKNETEYEDVLAEVEKLWGAEPDTSEGDQLDLLLLLVKDYNEKFYKLPELDPIEAIKYQMEEEGLNQSALAKRFGISRGVISEVLNNKKPLSLNLIKYLYHDLGIPPSILLS
jgi:HTH-type transcriptional regulator/antitoxin HigA